MSGAETAQIQTDSIDESNDLPERNDKRLAEYLRQKASEEVIYVKSKFISEDIDLSPKQIGMLMIQLQSGVSDLEIEKWSYTNATTWRIEAV